MNKILVIGSSNTDMTVLSSRLPRPGETVLGGEFRMGQGGKGANQAVAAKRLGGDAGFVCKIGRDIFGDNSLRAYEAEGLDVSGVIRCNVPSGVALITVDSEAENCIVVASGANGGMTPEDIQSVRGQIEQASIVLLQLEIPVPAVLEAARLAHNNGSVVVLNPAPACTLPEELLSYVDYLIPNQTEIGLLSGVDVSGDESALEAVRAIQKMGVRNVILTLGGRGSMMCLDGDGPKFVPALKVEAVDTTAAGDTFCGAFCVALSEGLPPEEAVRFATKSSALTVQRPGAQDSIPYRKEIL